MSKVRAHILLVATRQIAAKGVDSTSLQAIADEVGVKKQSILYHFPSKDLLHRAVLDELLSRWSEVLPRLFMATAQDGEARFTAVVGELVDFFAEDPDRARLLVREQLDRPQELQSYLQTYVRKWTDVVASTIRNGQGGRGIRDEVDPEAYVVLIVNLVLGTMATLQYAAALVSDDARERCTRELVRMARTSLFSDRE